MMNKSSPTFRYRVLEHGTPQLVDQKPERNREVIQVRKLWQREQQMKAPTIPRQKLRQ